MASRIRRVKARQWVRAWWAGIFAWAWRGVLGWISTSVIAAVVVYLMDFVGLQEMAGDEGFTALMYALVALAAGVIFFIFILIIAAFQASGRVREVGQWEEGLWIYNQPKLLATLIASENDNNAPKLIKIADAPVGSMITLKAETDGVFRNIEWGISGVAGIYANFYGFHDPDLKTPFFMTHLKARYSIRVPTGGAINIHTKVPQNSDVMSVRIYALQWKIDYE